MRLLDTFASRWAGDSVRAVLELAVVHTGDRQPSPPLSSTPAGPDPLDVA